MSQQSSLDMKANYKPHTVPFSPENPNVEMNSSLYRHKRPYNVPTNYIGIKSYRPDNQHPVRTYDPSGISGYYNFTGPVMRTQPVQPKFQ